MDERNFDPAVVDRAVVDRMVDGELDEGAEKELLSRLDGDPEGWRRLALAFVESRVWSRELPAVIRAPAEEEREPATPASEQHSAWSDFGWQMLTIASTLLLSFGLGLWVRGFWTPGVGGDGNIQAGLIPGASSASRAAGAAAQSGEPSRMLVAVPQARQGIEVPVFSANEIDPSWFTEAPQIVPRHVLKALERSGHRVEQRREFLPFQLQDGRQVIVPVDQVELHYVGRPVQ